MKLTGPGPWGVEDVSRATGVPPRTLHDWHKRGWAPARVLGTRGVLRYERRDVERVCCMAGLRARRIAPSRAAELCESIYAKVREAFHLHERPVARIG